MIRTENYWCFAKFVMAVLRQVRLQLQAQLAEKSRLANENPNLVRENQCLNQLVQY